MIFFTPSAQRWATITPLEKGLQADSDKSGDWKSLKFELDLCLFHKDDLKLIPSIPDRSAYKQAALEDNIDTDHEESFQVQALRIFSSNLEAYMASCTSYSQRIKLLKGIGKQYSQRP